MAIIEKAVIPAAGLGTRFLPYTKAIPKEMLPLVDIPIIERVVRELVDAGVRSVVIVTGSQKRSLEDHFDRNYELEGKLIQAGKLKESEEVSRIAGLADFFYVRQKGLPGNATPILNARELMGNDPFFVFWGDDFIDAVPSRADQLAEAYDKYHATILGGIPSHEQSDLQKYAFVRGREVENGVLRLDSIIEKPGSHRVAMSDLAIVSGFIATPDIFLYIEQAAKNLESGELVYTLAIQRLIDGGGEVYALRLNNARYYDTGNKLSYMEAAVHYAATHPEIGPAFVSFLRKYIEELPE